VCRGWKDGVCRWWLDTQLSGGEMGAWMNPVETKIHAAGMMISFVKLQRTMIRRVAVTPPRICPPIRRIDLGSCE